MKANEDSAEPFELIAADRLTPLVYAAPHSGRWMPPGAGADLQAGEATVRSLEDPRVDALIAGAAARGAATIINGTARAFVDVNRDPAEMDPDLLITGRPGDRRTPRTRAGLGVVPRLGGDGQPLWRRPFQVEELRARVDQVHASYHAALAGLMADARAQFGRAVLIDWHSMPSVAAMAEQRRGGLRPDIVIGDRHGQSADPALARIVRTAFEARGRRVIMNRPFAGGYTTQLWARPADGFHALQIEIDRSLYLDERTLEPGPGFDALRRDIDLVGAALSAALGTKKAAPESAA